MKLCGDRDPLFPVQAFFNSVSDDSFLRALACITQSTGFSTDYCHCRFPTDLDPEELRFEGVQFSLFQDVIVIPHHDFVTYLGMACQSYLEVRADDSQNIAKLLDPICLSKQETR
jgi:CDI immunity protein